MESRESRRRGSRRLLRSCLPCISPTWPHLSIKYLFILRVPLHVLEFQFSKAFITGPRYPGHDKPRTPLQSQGCFEFILSHHLPFTAYIPFSAYGTSLPSPIQLLFICVLPRSHRNPKKKGRP